MSLLTDIERAATTSTEPLTDLLRRCKVLAARLKHAEFASWVSHELNGYDVGGDALPSYRRAATPNSQGTLLGPFAQAKNVPLPIRNLPEDVRKLLVRTPFHQSVGTLQELAKIDHQGHLRPWDPTLVGLLQNHFHEDMSLAHAEVQIPPGTVAGILDTVRTRVLDFVLAIQAENPDAGEVAPDAPAPIPSQNVTNIFNSTIVGGHANIGTTGSASIANSNATTTLNLDATKRGELESLIKDARVDAEKLPSKQKKKTVVALDRVASSAAAGRLDPKKVREWMLVFSAASAAAPNVAALAQWLQHLVVG